MSENKICYDAAVEKIKKIAKEEGFACEIRERYPYKVTFRAAHEATLLDDLEADPNTLCFDVSVGSDTMVRTNGRGFVLAYSLRKIIKVTECAAEDYFRLLAEGAE